MQMTAGARRTRFDRRTGWWSRLTVGGALVGLLAAGALLNVATATGWADGLAHALAARPDEALDDLQAAAEQFAAAGLPRAERAVLVEAATLATERSTPQRGARLRAWARTAAARAGDQEAEVDLDLLDAALAVTGEDLDRALSLTWRARQRALDGVAPVKYLSAAIALAELHDLRGEHGSAYEALSTAWATLADLMGSETARAVVQPRLQLLVDRWGVEEFTAVKKRYEARRRAQLGLA